MKILIFLLILITILHNCAFPTKKDRFNELISSSNNLAKVVQDLKNKGNNEEAIKLAFVLQQLYENDPFLKNIILNASEEELDSVTQNEWLGFNQGVRTKVDSTIVEKVLWYIPDRILDFVDQFDFWLDIGPAGAGGWITKYGQVMFYVKDGWGVGFGQKRMFGYKRELKGEIGIGPFGFIGHGWASGGGFKNRGKKVGTGGIHVFLDKGYLHKPTRNMYQNYEDFWSIGAKAGLFLGCEVVYHPLETYDFLAGLFFFDPLNDDYATSRVLEYDSKQKKSIINFVNAFGNLNDEELEEFLKKYPILRP